MQEYTIRTGVGLAGAFVVGLASIASAHAGAGERPEGERSAAASDAAVDEKASLLPDEVSGGETPAGVPQGARVFSSGAWVLRVGGEAVEELSWREGRDGPLFRAGVVMTDTKLPVGYAPPTPPGAIEIKHYPEVRRAEFSSDARVGMMGQNGFWPLFQHISRNDIAMTAPVEMEYADVETDPDLARWTMAFLYHTPDDGPTGNDGRILIVDTEPKTFLSIGVRGRTGWTGVNRLSAQLDAWLEENPGWKRAGPMRARTLGYNGPNVRTGNQWWEVQIQIEPVERDEATD
ncbi:MAG: heme-binding protein [Phycisphaerales bacterium]|nr:heme-binding protein [Phycisphaerales bacterium]